MAVDDLAKAAELAETASENMTKTTQSAKKMSDAFKKLSTSNVDLIKNFSALGNETVGVGEQMTALSQAVKETFASMAGWKKIADSLVDSFVKTGQQLANQLDKSRAEYVKTTGDVENSVGRVSEAMADASQSISKFGANLAPAFSAIQQNLPQMQKAFDGMTEEIKKTAVVLTQLNELGVSTKTSATNINAFADAIRYTDGATTNMAQAQAQATQQMAQFVLQANQMGYSLQESAAIIERNNDLITIFGDDALTALMRTAKETRIELDSLVAVSEKFSTFDKAADHVGKLNALLGADYLSVTEMMFAEPTEQVNMISDAFRQAGLSAESLDGMSEAEKNFFATTIQSTLGLKSKSEALRFLQADEFEQARILKDQDEAAKKQIDAQEKLNEILLNSMGALEAFSNAWKQIADVLTPVFTTINEITLKIANFMSGLDESTKTVIGWIVLIVAVIGSLLLSIAPVMGAAAAAAATAAAATATLGATASISAPQILALGGAFFLMGLGVGLAAAGIGYMASQIAGLGEQSNTFLITLGALIVLFIAFGVALYFVAAPAAAAAPGLLALGAAFLMIGFGIGIAAAGIGVLVMAFSTLGDVIDKISAPITAFFNGLSTFAGTVFTGISTALKDVGELLKLFVDLDKVSFTGIAAGIVAVSAALTSLAVGAGPITGIGSLLTFGSSPIKVLEQLNNILTTFDADKLDRISTSINLMVKALNTPISTAAIERLEQAAKVIKASDLGGGTTTGGAARGTVTPVEPRIEIQQVVIKFDDVTEFEGYIEDIIDVRLYNLNLVGATP